MSDMAIVAIPKQDDHVWKISSEKVPHLTLLYLGDNEVSAETTLHILQFVEHVAKTTLHRFGLSVDRRGTLGDKQADVLFFRKDWTEDLVRAREYLLADAEIARLHRTTTQYPEWKPHLTLGYPESPAKPDERDYPTNWVEFDRIALWTGDFEGPEFLLEEDKGYGVDAAWSALDFKMSDIPEGMSVEEFLAHYGIKGMKWGVRRSERQLAVARKKGDVPADEDAVKAVQTQKKISEAGSLNVVSSKELQHLVNRIELEKKYVNLTTQASPQAQKGQSFISKLFRNEVNSKLLQGKDGPILSMIKAAQAARKLKIQEALESANNARKATAKPPKTKKRRSAPTNNVRVQQNPAWRRSQRAQTVYDVTSLGGNTSLRELR